jgi:signal transduction histidine kinase
MDRWEVAVPGRARELVIGVAVLGVGVTGIAVVLPAGAVVYRSATLHVAVEVSAALIGLLVCVLSWGRFVESRQWRDLALTYAVGMFATVNLAFSAIPVIAGGDGSWLTWGRLGGTVLASAGLAASAFWPDRTVPSLRRGVNTAFGAWAISVAGIALLGGVTKPLAALTPPAGVFLIHGLVALLMGAAAAGYLRRAHRTSDGLLTWVAAAATLGAFARVNYLLFPDLYPAWIYTGDALRLGFYLLLVVGAGRELTAYWRDREQAAVLEERRRLAREFHDGLAQELAFIATQARRLGEDSRVAASAQRALGEARAAIAALTRPIDEPLEAAFIREAEDVSIRTGTKVRLVLAPGVHVYRTVQNATLRIMREALTNAARHGHADHVSVELPNRNGILLRVIDDGAVSLGRYADLLASPAFRARW